MKIRVGLLILACLVMVSQTSCRSESKRIDERNSLLDSVFLDLQKDMYKLQIDSMVINTGFNGVISIYQDTVEMYSIRNGFRDFAKQSPFIDHTVFSIASVSKQMTAVMILRLQEHGKLKVTDLVSQYLEDYKQGEKKAITIHQLLTHSAGIYDFGPGLQFKPGSDFGYSNVGYNDLGRIIEKASGQTYDSYADAMFTEIGMINTKTPALLNNPNFASAHQGLAKNPRAVANMPMRLTQKGIGVPAGGILSTIEDLHLWNIKLYNGQIIDSASFENFSNVHTQRKGSDDRMIGYGYGIQITQKDPKTYYHTGYVNGTPSLNLYYPDTRTSIVILSNFADDSKSRGEVFKPHFQVKAWADALQLVIPKLRNQYRQVKE